LVLKLKKKDGKMDCNIEVIVPSEFAIEIIVHGAYDKGMEIEEILKQAFPRANVQCVGFKPYRISMQWPLPGKETIKKSIDEVIARGDKSGGAG
jgi:hypothetical protein